MPRVDEVLRLLRQTGVNVVTNTVALGLADRHRRVKEILPPISNLMRGTGRPHWIIVDEAHQFFSEAPGGALRLPDAFPASIFITVSPENLSGDILKRIDVVIAFGRGGFDKLARLYGALGCAPPRQAAGPLDGEAFVWSRHPDGSVLPIQVDSPRQAHRRHMRKYAMGDVGELHSFYFRGPDNKGNSRARNVWEFVDAGRVVDDAAWQHHLREHDYSAWFRNVIKDEELARLAKEIEDDSTLKPHESRAGISRLILSRYAAPAS